MLPLIENGIPTTPTRGTPDFLSVALAETELKDFSSFVLLEPDLLAKNFPPVEWIVRNLIPARSLVFFAGAPGSYKTFFALNAVCRLASGSRIFDTVNGGIGFYSEPGPIIPTCILEEEMNPAYVVERLKKFPHEPSPLFHLAFSTGFKLSDPEARKRLLEYVKKYKIRVLVLDPFSSVIGVEDENNNMMISKVLDAVRREFIDKDGSDLTIILIHHPAKVQGNKSVSLRGAGDIMGKADFVLEFERSDKEPLTTIKCVKSRLCELTELPIIKVAFEKQADDKLHVVLRELVSRFEAEKEKKPKRSEEIKESILSVFEGVHAPIPQTEVLERLACPRSGSFIRAWEELLAEKKIFYDPETKGFRKDLPPPPLRNSDD